MIPWRKGPQEAPTVAQRRARALPTNELLTWAQNALYGIGRALSDHERGDPNGLDDALMGADTLRVVVEEVRRRNPR